MSIPIDYTLTTKKPVEVKSVKLSILDPETIRRRSVVCVTESTMYERNLPKQYGVNDHRMGGGRRDMICGECGNTLEICNGHEGHIELYWPVYHPGFISKVHKILQTVCYHCSNLNYEVKDKQKAIETMNPKQRFLQYAQSFKEKKGHIECKHCYHKQPKYKQHPIHIEANWKGLTAETDYEEKLFNRSFTACDARKILCRISDENCKLLGFDPVESRPEWMIITALVVPPPCIRPSIVDSEGSKNRGQDDLTNKLQEIVKANHIIGEKIEKNYGPPILFGGAGMKLPSQSTSRVTTKKRGRKSTVESKLKSETAELSNSIHFSQLLEACEVLDIVMPRYEINQDMIIDSEDLEKLQMHVATYINNNISGMKQSTQRSGAPTKSLFSRYKGKNNRFRNNLSGKRTDFSSRSVITGDPNIDPDQVGVPHHIAKVLSVPEKVTSFNFNRLLQCVRGGPNELIGANSIITENQVMIELDDDNRKDIDLQIGWTVERHLKDDDYVCFNRQPSLRDVSMMAHRVRLMPGRTIRLNLCVTAPYSKYQIIVFWAHD